MMSILFLTLLTSFVFISTASQSAPYTDANAPWNVNFNRNGSKPAEYYGQWPGHDYFKSPQDWRDVGVYQFITDRWRDGNPSNNEGGYGGYNIYDVGNRHGGDFKGVEDTLGYIKSLGYDAIWISPIFQNRFNSYHGYAQIDFTLLDDRFGTLAEFRSMVDKAHSLGMYVIVDMVVNHLDNLLYFEGHKDNGAPFRMHEGEYRIFPRNPDQTYADFWVNNNFDSNGSYSDVYGYDGYLKRDTFGRGSFWESDFHHNGNLDNYDDAWQNHTGKIYGIMDDLRTTHPRVQDKIIAMSKALISSTDIDGMRLDTPMQVPLYFFKRWAPAVKEHARSLGKDNFFIFGEFYCPRARSATMVGRGKTPEHYNSGFAFIDDTPTMDAGINYDLYFSFMGPAIKEQKNGNRNALTNFEADMKAYDFFNPARKTVMYTMLNFFNNHDQWRLNWEADGFQKTLLASSIIAFWPGVPLFYYGDEQGFATEGSALDGRSREDFMTSKAWFDGKSKYELNPVVFDNFNMTHPHYLKIQRLMNVRKQYHALRNTQELHERWSQTNNTNGIFAYTRVWGEPKNWVFVAFNTYKLGLTAGGDLGDLDTGWNEGDVIVNALDPQETYRLEKGGRLRTLSLEGYQTKVFVRQDNLQTLNPVVESVHPSHDAEIAMGMQRIEIRFSEPMQEDSVKTAIFFDDKKVDSQNTNYDSQSKKLSFDVEVKEGIHKIVVKQWVKAQNGKTMWSDFVSRLRAGEQSNPLVHLQKEPLQDESLALVRNDDGKFSTVNLSHKAAGAAKFRVSLDYGKTWNVWQDYARESELRISNEERARNQLLVQYWMDGSAAYFVRGDFH